MSIAMGGKWSAGSSRYKYEGAAGMSMEAGMTCDDESPGGEGGHSTG